MADAGQRIWEITVAVRATDDEIDGVVDRIGAALCPEANHDGPCPNPWFIITTGPEALTRSRAAFLRELVG